MLNSIHIENYKSIDTLDLELGRINVFIGENGCGKTNIISHKGAKTFYHFLASLRFCEKQTKIQNINYLQ